jgi:uncharacterized protein YbjT (DUF2867 family)
LAGDALTLDQMVTAISRATGRALPLSPAHKEHDAQIAVGEVEGKFSFSGWQADFPALRAQHPALMDFNTWLACEGKPMIEALLDRAEAR